MTVLLGSLAAALFGIGDLVAGVGGRRDGSDHGPSGVAFVATLVGAVVSAFYLFVVSDDHFTGNDFWWALAAGVSMSAARPMLYRGMKLGPIVVFAPVYALMALVVPALIGPLVGQGLAPLEIVGLVLALPAVALVSSERRLPRLAELRHSPVLGLGCVVGLLVGIAGLCLSFVSDGAGAAPAFVITTVGILIVPLSAAAIGQSVRRPSRTTAIFGSMVGVTSAGAFILTSMTYQRGSAAVGSALIGLSPGISIVLAWRLLGERIWPIQLVGGALGAVTVLLFALA